MSWPGWWGPRRPCLAIVATRPGPTCLEPRTGDRLLATEGGRRLGSGWCRPGRSRRPSTDTSCSVVSQENSFRFRYYGTKRIVVGLRLPVGEPGGLVEWRFRWGFWVLRSAEE